MLDLSVCDRRWVERLSEREFLTTEANREVGAIHPKAMPVILM